MVLGLIVHCQRGECRVEPEVAHRAGGQGVREQMTVRKIWIGDPFDPDFEWRGQQQRRATPRSLSDLPGSDRLWQALGRHFSEGHLSARRTDQDDWIGLATRRELEALVDEAFAGENDPTQLELRRTLSRLDRKTIYYLVASRDEGDA